METPFIQPFRIGDEVEIVKSEESSEIGEKHIIGNVSVEPDVYEYATDKAAWFSHDQFKLVRECCAETMALLRKSIEDEDDEDHEDDDEDEEDWEDEHNV